MATNSPLLLLSLILCFLFLNSRAQLEQPQYHFWKKLNQHQQHRLRLKTQCQIQQLNAHEPSFRYRAEAGLTEFWDSSSEDFECAGIQFIRHTIEPQGLLLPYYTNAPQLVYIVQGSGVLGTVIPGCAETYESEESGSSSYQEGGRTRREQEGQGGRTMGVDRHQKIRRFRQGDILALQEGITHWAYNDGETPIISVALLDVANENNQLDLKFRKFFLAGNPQVMRSESQQRERQYRGGEGQQRPYMGGERGEEEQQQGQGNVFSGFDEEILAESLRMDAEVIRRLQAREDDRGAIVRAERLRFNFPEYSRQEQERQQQQERGREQGYNGMEETFCSFRIRENIDNPARADVFNPRGGRITSINSQDLPILGYLRLTAQRGVIYRNALVAPHWTTNAHSAMYITRGSARIQVVGSQGQSVFDGEVNQGQLLIVPQNFAVIKRASEQGFEFITFKTNDNAMNSHLAGRLSAIRSMPEEVLVNAYGISREDARNLKYGREESTLFSPGSRSGGGYA